MSQLGIIIVDKSGTLKSLNVKNYSEEELYKKCNFKKPHGFIKQTDWNVKITGQKYIVSVFAKTDGKANMENKYDFPPPIDTKLFFGSCAIVAMEKNADGTTKMCNLTIPLWDKIYKKLFGGFEDLSATALEDENEEDELANVPAKKKTKDGYLKDGFIIDTESDENEDYETACTGSSDEEAEDETESSDELELLDAEDIGSELSEEEYDYSTEEEEPDK